MDYIIVGAGGFIGAIARFAIHTIEKNQTHNGFPYGTLFINVTGCFLAGLLLSVLELKIPSHRQMYLLLMAGFLSSFTTFSSFSAETLTLFRNGEVFSGLLNVILNLTLGLVAVWCGRILVS